jgi:RiboL-PSP-HEPN
MQQALSKLQLSTSRIRSLADDVDANAKAALADPDIQARHETTLAASIVILSGFFESFLRELAEAVITEICGRGIPFPNLPDKVRITHFREGGAVLQNAMRQESKLQPLALAQSSDIARRLASVNAAQPQYELVWEAFADTQGNPGSQTISDFLRRFDIDQPLPTLAAAMNSFEPTLSLRLRSFIEIRNECAHTGRTTNIVTTSTVNEHCTLVEAVAAAMVQVFQVRLANPPYVAAPLSPPSASASGTPVGVPAVPSSGASLVSQFLLSFVRRILRAIRDLH